ncbi:MAG: DUF5985 family protein [Roseateles sp.]|uniref:DUF5985 family protein n=1 Tax=Roseateles sp. TaxID=1971397 RepID=UPI0040355660
MSNDLVAATLVGGIAAGCFVVGLAFLRYWRSTRDRFFLFFMLSFWIEAANRVHMAMTASWNEGDPVHYMVRLLAYALIVVAIWDKNRPRRP